MAQIAEYSSNGTLVFKDDTQRHRIYDVIGPNVVKWKTEAKDCGATSGTNPFGYVTTLVECGGGESSVLAATTPGFEWLVTTDAMEADSVNIQLAGETFAFDQSQDVYFYAKIQINDVDQTDLFIGMGVVDTEWQGGVADAAYFESLDGSASLSFVTEVGSAETQTDSVHTLEDGTTVELEFYYDASEDKVYVYVDGALITSHTAGITAEDITPTIEFETGEGAAQTMLVNARAFQFTA